MHQLVELIRAGGIVMYPLLFLAVVAVAIIVERLWVFAKIGGVASGLFDATISLCAQGDFESALSRTTNARGPVAAALAVVLKHRERPVEAIERYVQEIGEEYFIRLEQRLSVLDTITTISPLLGLLGTIIGMIGAFEAISAQQAAGNSDYVLHGVAEALYATATGISIAVVCFIAYNYFSTRLRHVTTETEMIATKFINELSELAQP